VLDESGSWSERLAAKGESINESSQVQCTTSDCSSWLGRRGFQHSRGEVQLCPLRHLPSERMGRIAETDRTLHCEDGDSHPIHLTGIVSPTYVSLTIPVG
jgi:hypothetical protein